MRRAWWIRDLIYLAIFIAVLIAAWWALDFPFMKRYSPEYLARHPDSPHGPIRIG